MLKHKGFPSRMPGTDYQFTIRRESKSGPTPLVRRERYRDRKPADLAADMTFLAALYEYFGDAPFARGNLDAGRLSWVLGREVIPVDDPFDAESYEAQLRLDLDEVNKTFPEVLEDDED